MAGGSFPALFEDLLVVQLEASSVPSMVLVVVLLDTLTHPLAGKAIILGVASCIRPVLTSNLNYLLSSTG